MGIANKHIYCDAVKKATVTTCRIYVAVTFLIYGAAKFWPGQFRHGEAVVFDSTKNTPFELAWAFFGHSRLYEIFIGAGEVAGALLLLFPRTRTLGAFVCFPIVLNIMIINYCFDIGVQDLSTLLVAMCAYLLWIDRKKWIGMIRDEGTEKGCGANGKLYAKEREGAL
ncbi:hypothetical protein BSNK01_00950 [Bacillaceae bacterium]